MNLRICYWLNGQEHSWLKVRTSVIRLAKRGFQQHKTLMPDEVRDVVFRQGIPVTVINVKALESNGAASERRALEGSPSDEDDAASAKAEAGIYKEASVIKGQAGQVQLPDDEENLLRTASEAQPRQ